MATRKKVVAIKERTVTKYIREVISELEPGSRLPTEAEFARQYGVSRPTVRAALAVLRAEGLVVSRVGGSGATRGGHYVASSKPAGQKAHNVRYVEVESEGTAKGRSDRDTPDVYVVTVVDDVPVACTCRAYHYSSDENRTCKHLRTVEQL